VLLRLLPVYWWVRVAEVAPGLLVGPYYRVCSRFIGGSVLLRLLPVYWWVRVAHLFSFLCCSIMCIYVLSSVL
jgi:hypothetical protein